MNTGWWLVSIKNWPGVSTQIKVMNTIYAGVLHQKHHNFPCLGSSNPSVAPSLGRFLNIDMASKQMEIIEVPDDDPDNFPNSGPQNPVEAQSYRDKIDGIMDTFSDLLADNHKDALRSTITSLKKLMVKHWWQMAEANVEVVMRLIHDPSCIYLHQHLTIEGINVMEPVMMVPEGWTFLRQLPKKVWKMEVQELIVTCLNHLLEVHVSHVVICSQHVIPGQDHQPWDLWHGHEGSCSTNDPDQCPGILSESGAGSTPQRWPQKNDCPSLRESCSPEWCLLHRNHGTDPPGY